MSDRPEAWEARRRAWRVERLDAGAGAPARSAATGSRPSATSPIERPVRPVGLATRLGRTTSATRARAARPPSTTTATRCAPGRRPLRRRGPAARRRPARRAAVHPRHPPHRLPVAAVDDAHVRGLRQRRGHQRPLPPAARRRPDGPLDRLRHADALRLRHRRPRGRGRVRDVRRRREQPGRHGAAARGPAARPRQHLDDDQLAGRADLGDVHRGGREAGRAARRASRARPRTTSSRSTSPRRSSCSRPSRRCASSSTRSSSGRASCRAGTRSRSAATTSARRARRRSRSWRSRSPTAWPTWRRASSRGLRVDDFAPRLSFFFNSHSDFFEEIAKFRASRRIWWKLMSERYRAENERSTWMRFHTQTAGVSLTPQQPLNNLTRVATQALAAILGGTQSLHTDAYDEALAVPDGRGRAARAAPAADPGRGDRRGVDRRPAGRLVVRGGADQPRRARGLALPRRDRPPGRHGRRDRRGLPAARDRGRRLPVPARVRRGRAGDRRASTATSTTSRSRCPCSRCRRGRWSGTWPASSGPARSATTRPSAPRWRACARRRRRPGHERDNLMPHFLRCAERYATLGEQCRVLREVFGEYREPVSV